MRTFCFVFLVFMIALFNEPIYAFKDNSTLFYIVRHGQTDWNVQKKIQGHKDIPLNEAGRDEAMRLADELKGISFAGCFSSDLQRACETANLLTDGSITVNTDMRLRERNFGHWEGRFADEILNASEEETMDVENDFLMRERIFQCLTEIAEQYPGDRILIVAHGGVIRNILANVLLFHCSSDCIETKNTAVLQLSFSKDRWSVKELKGIKLPEPCSRI